MPCFDPDGNLSRLAIAALEAILDQPLDDEGIAEATGRPPDTGRRFARSLQNAGLIEKTGGRYDITDHGRERLYAER